MADLPTRTSDGRTPVPLTDAQRYLMDLRGWLLIPGVLRDDEVAEMREFCLRLARDRESIPAAHRTSIGGPLEALIDHPVAVGFLNAFVAHPPHASEDGYGFRLENSFLTVRDQGFDNFAPHGGGGMHAFPGNSHTYHCYPGHANSALTRLVWELNPVRRGDGGTAFVTGSHKAAFPGTADLMARDSWLWEDYECPAGSLLCFTEAITHTGMRWNHPDTQRISIFNCYNCVNARWHDWDPPQAHVDAMPPLRRSLFRPVNAQSARIG